MKVLILSDVHSNIQALEAVWSLEKDSDAIYCVGDLVDYGPYPNEVLDWMRSHQVQSVQGNHDAWVSKRYRENQSLHDLPTEDYAWVDHNVSLLTEDDIVYLEQLPETLTFSADGFDYALTHIYDQYREIKSQHQFEVFRDSRFDGYRYNRLLLGHTHRQSIRLLSDDLLWMNPGSLSYRRPDDPDQTAHYAIITDGELSLRRATYDHHQLFLATQQLKLNERERRHEWAWAPRSDA
ncbi:MAG: metallophosphoesterase family protein [Pseudomonadota bacterium]